MEKRSGLNSGYLSQLERGSIANPTPSVLQKVAVAYERPFGILMRWAGYIEDDPDNLSPNAQRALNVLGDDFSDQELEAMRAVLDAIRARNSATFAAHRTDLVLTVEERDQVRRDALAVVRQLGVLDTDAPVNMDEALLVAKLVKVGAIDLTVEEKRRLRDRFKGLVDKALTALQGVVHLGRGTDGEVYLNPALNRWERKKRFVTSHEIGHAVMADHRATFAHLEDGARLTPEFNDRLERQANQFSIDLLAKGDRLREEFDDSPPSMDRLDDLAGRYGISYEATGRYLGEESRNCCAMIVAYYSKFGDRELLVQHHKVWTSAVFEQRMGWSAQRPRDEIHTSLRTIGAGLTAPPIPAHDRQGLPVQVAVEGLTTPFSVLLLVSCPPAPRLNLRRAKPLARIRTSSAA